MTRTNVEIVERFFERPPEGEVAELIDPEVEIYDYQRDPRQAREAAGIPSSSG
jgi:hypothetical protein